MSQPLPTTWLGRVRELHSMAQVGLEYATSPYDQERYGRLRELAADMTAALAEAEPERVRMLVLETEGYLTPKLDVRAAVFDDQGRVLLVREAADGGWTMPGGWSDVNESITEGAVREVEEESGYLVRADRLLGLYERERWGHPPSPFFTYKAVVACDLVGGERRTSYETTDVGWFAADDLPPLSLPRMSPQLLARTFEHHADPSLPQDID